MIKYDTKCIFSSAQKVHGQESSVFSYPKEPLNIGTNIESVFKTHKSSDKEEENLVEFKDLNLLSKIGEGAFGEVVWVRGLVQQVSLKELKLK